MDNKDHLLHPRVYCHKKMSYRRSSIWLKVTLNAMQHPRPSETPGNVENARTPETGTGSPKRSEPSHAAAAAPDPSFPSFVDAARILLHLFRVSKMY